MSNSKPNLANDYNTYPEFPAAGRVYLSGTWLPKECKAILDAGCSWGYATNYYKQVAETITGIDVVEQSIEIAKGRYPEIRFHAGYLDKTPFEDKEFDAIVLNDVLEHVPDEIDVLNELNRVLADGGTLIITTPHKGLFGFLDPGNYSYGVKKYLPGPYRLLYKLIKRREPNLSPPSYADKHRHYSINDFRKMLEASSFKGRYKIDTVFRSGLFGAAVLYNLEFLLNVLFGQKVSKIITKPLLFIERLDFWLPAGPLSYNIALRVIKSSH